MTGVPEEITKRRELLDARAEQMRLDAEFIASEIAAIDFCIAAIKDAAKTPSAEAGDGYSDIVAALRPLAAEIASAGTRAALSGINEIQESKKPRAPKRDIRGMVLEYVEHGGENVYQDEIWRLLGVAPRAVASAIAYWQAKGRLTLDGGVVRLLTAVPPHEEAYRVGEEDGRAGNRDHAARWPAVVMPDYERGHAEGQRVRHVSSDPLEITGQGADVYFIASELEGTVVANLRRREVEVPDGIVVDAAAE